MSDEKDKEPDSSKRDPKKTKTGQVPRKDRDD